jgi:hypothetical protein
MTRFNAVPSFGVAEIGEAAGHQQQAREAVTDGY